MLRGSLCNGWERKVRTVSSPLPARLCLAVKMSKLLGDREL